MDENEQELDDETTGDQGTNKVEKKKPGWNLAPWQYKKGQSGNPAGRPEGISMKEYIRKKFRTMTDEEREEYLAGMDKSEILRQAEGAPVTKGELGGPGGGPVVVQVITGMKIIKDDGDKLQDQKSETTAG